MPGFHRELIGLIRPVGKGKPYGAMFNNQSNVIGYSQIGQFNAANWQKSFSSESARGLALAFYAGCTASWSPVIARLVIGWSLRPSTPKSVRY